MSLVDKLRPLIVPAVVTGIALASTTGVLRAYQSVAPRRPDAKVARQQSRPIPSPAAVPAALPRADEDARSDRLVDMQIEAEMLEFRISARKSAIQAGLQALMSFDRNQPSFAIGLTEEQARAQRAMLEKTFNERQDSLFKLQSDYAADKKKFARLKREITRQSKALGEPAESAPDVAELARRLESLEAKVDKLVKGQSDKSE
jgi:hypothetical protein